MPINTENKQKETIILRHSNINDPTIDQKSALTGTSGSPSNGNKFVTDQDSRMTNARTPSSHTHTESEVTNLVTDLAGKEQSLGNPSLNGQVLSSTTGGLRSWIAPGLGYAINVQALTSSPTDGATVYFGMLPKAPTTTANISKIYIRKDGTIKIAEIYTYSGTAGSNEAWSLYIRLNNTADYLIATVSAATNERVFSNTSLSIAVAAGNYIQIKGIQPTWGTNPATTIYGGYIYIE
jgi:hypothetical protein